ncbi:MAG TPA: MFS transporter [Stackebrandtia sp.]|jgi:CP family cyanate transporter-like MFS transporter|uniref:CynX/NimT family MFS transporter n=1 Tax=Stackebrandtia sp. TaxID=2023065 RepID=UPI002D6EE290|nr:MFS transporter [Stackebrandtia sp.]HZE39815.1 MFS transporter [Stackebrandtia sp.]
MTAVTTAERTSPTRGTITWIITAGVLLAAFNMRTAVTSVGPLLDEIERSLGMTDSVAGVLTTLPVIGFGIFGGLTPALSRRFGERIVMLDALALMVIGLVVRSTVDSEVVFLIASAAALAGGAVANVALPAVVKRHYPNRVGAMTTAYSTSLAVGTMLAAGLTVPAAHLFGDSWRPALAMWAVPALIALIPWFLTRSTARPGNADAEPTRPVRGLARSRFGWTMMIAFGAQSMIAYIMFGWLPELLRDHGFSSTQAGLMLGIFTAVSIPISIVVPLLAARLRQQRGVLAVLVGGYVVGMPLLLVGGHSAVAWIGLLAVAVGMGTFPLMLTLFALRARTHAGTAAISAFTQSGGYLIAGIGPVLVGVLLDLTGGWTAPFVLLGIAAVTHAVAAWQVTRPRFVEDEVATA